MLSAKDYLHYLAVEMAHLADPGRAVQQKRYMKDKFEFFGLGTPTRRPLTRVWMKREGIFYGEELEAFVKMSFGRAQRELHYAAIEMVERAQKKSAGEQIELLEWMVTHKSWWDSVDVVAKLIGRHFRRFPEMTVPVTERWMNSENMWLQRVCIIFQLEYKTETDFDLLSKYILQLADSKEFFIRKAQGWALRQYSKSKPELVSRFLSQHGSRLSGLTVREASKYI